MSYQESNNIELNKKFEKMKEPIILNESNTIKYLQVLQIIKLMLSTNDYFNNIINQSKIIISSKQINKIKNILNYLAIESENTIPINNIIHEIKIILSDKKIELFEIPKLINIIHESLINLKIIQIKINDIGIIIKLIFYILIETKIIIMSNDNYELISIIFDNSMILLYKSIKISKFNKCLCFLN
jgi:hypothetical protein